MRQWAAGFRAAVFRKPMGGGPPLAVAVLLNLGLPAPLGAQAQEQPPAPQQQGDAAPQSTQKPQAAAQGASMAVAEQENPSDPTDRTGDLSLGVSFGFQGSPSGKEAIGMRVGLSRDFFAGLSVQHGFDGPSEAEAYAAYLESGYDLARSGRAKLAVVGTLAGGLYSPSSTTPAGRTGGGPGRGDELFLGFAAGVQLEVWLLAEISLALKAEWGGQVMPDDLQKFSTASSELQVFLHLDGGRG